MATAIDGAEYRFLILQFFDAEIYMYDEIRSRDRIQ